MTKKNDSVIEINDLRFNYPNQADTLNIKRLQVEARQKVFVQGNSGSGKSTLLNILCGVHAVKSGEVNVLGKPFHALRASQRDSIRAKHIGVVFQQFNLIPYLSVMENIQLAGYFSGSSRQLSTDIVSLLNDLSLPRTICDKRADQLSVGQQQRVAIARALINKPALVIADEPTSALDASATNDFITALLKVCAAANSALVFVSHDAALAGYFDLSIEMSSINEVAYAI